MKPIKVFSLEEAVLKVREKYPSATAEGSTFDWSFWVSGKVVANMVTNRRSKKHEWMLTFVSDHQNAAESFTRPVRSQKQDL